MRLVWAVEDVEGSDHAFVLMMRKPRTACVQYREFSVNTVHGQLRLIQNPNVRKEVNCARICWQRRSLGSQSVSWWFKFLFKVELLKMWWPQQRNGAQPANPHHTRREKSDTRPTQ